MGVRMRAIGIAALLLLSAACAQSADPPPAVAVATTPIPPVAPPSAPTAAPAATATTAPTSTATTAPTATPTPTDTPTTTPTHTPTPTNTPTTTPTPTDTPTITPTPTATRTPTPTATPIQYVEWINAPIIENGVLSFSGSTQNGALLKSKSISRAETRAEVRCDEHVIAEILDPLPSGYVWEYGSPHNKLVSAGYLWKYLIVPTGSVRTGTFSLDADISQPLETSYRSNSPKCGSIVISVKGVIGSTYDVTIAEVPVECPAANCAKDE